jgi:hypothetical protein
MKHIYLILLMLIPCTLSAESGYWVCIGSYRDQDVAANYRLASAHEFPDELRVVEAETSMGRYFRVVVGPFETALRANEVLEDAQRERPDAWLLVTSANGDPGATGSVDNDYSYQTDSSYQTDYSYDTDYIDNKYIDDPDGGRSYSDPDDGSAEWSYRAPVVQGSGEGIEVTSTPKVVEEAPPGYNVHKLNPGAVRTDD